MIRVLIIDDSLFMRTIIKDMLSRDPEISVVGTAANGEEGLVKIRELAPDVVTLDIEMPRMNGLEVLKQKALLKHQPKTLMLSSLTSNGAIMTQKAMNLGADDFMLKPKDSAAVREIGMELINKIKNLVKITYVRKKTIMPPGPAENLVVIGSSAGGPPMLDVVISSFRPGIPAAILITQHMPEGGFTAALAQRLNRISSMPVKETENGDILNTGHIYIAKAGFHAIISGIITGSGKKGGKIVHSLAPPVHSVRPAVDKTFISAADVFGPKTVSAILSGMGSDGGEGTLAIKKHGGVTIVCREEDCLVYGMARSALDRQCVDFIVPLSGIADEINRAITTIAG
ncbi:MAG TPA: chemotaxis-specific protein-glutamate methyltransferase CheB [Methanoregulaceae archaeon]|nr:chemotaxis-specific protein-glutamate methyltransferase CheB [Methanoregulaceae archaeon]